MRFVSFTAERRASFGIATQDGVFDLGARLGPAIPDLRTYLHLRTLGFDDALVPATTTDYREGEFRYLPAIPNPGKILCVGQNYEEHRKEVGRPKVDHPAIFTRFADTLLGHGEAIRLPTISTALDFEGELAVVIGRPAFRLTDDQALSVVAGYACFNDASLRDWQRHGHQFTPGKNFPATGPFGPALVTADELSPERLAGCRIETRLNGDVVQSAVLGDMIFPVARVIAYVSGFTRLAAGDVIATGTPGGVGEKREPRLFMKPGDVVEVRIEDVGVLRNPIAPEEQDAFARGDRGLSGGRLNDSKF